MCNHAIIIGKPFQDVLDGARRAIIDVGFLIIHEIDTTAIMRKAGFEITETRQLLFFHPSYMKTIFENDPQLVILAPLKIVVQQSVNGETLVTYTSPLKLFQGYARLQKLQAALENEVNTIIERLKD